MKIAVLTACLLFAAGASAADRSARIVDEGHLGKTHALAAGAQLAAPGYPAAYADSGDDVCIALGYTVKPDGTTGDFRLLKAWSSDRAHAEQNERYLDTFAAAAADAVSQWRFAPREGAVDGTIDTVATLTFRGNGTTTALADSCRIKNLAAHYTRLENGRIALRRTVEAGRDRQIAIDMQRAESFARRAASPSPP